MLKQKIAETITFLNSKTGLRPDLALVLGSGLGELGRQIEDAVVIPYSEIPHFKQSTAPGHNGALIIGTLQGKNVVCMQGRVHFYEGYSMQEITYPVRVFSAWGVETLILTNSCGGLDPDFTPGDLMVITDHINFMGANPLIGANEDDFGTRFPDMTETYTKELISLAKECAGDLELELKDGVYVSYSGPSFETPAEIRWFQTFGAQAVGMSTVPEAIVAHHCGMKLMAISCITNLAAGILEQPLSGEEVMVVANQVSGKFTGLIREVIRRM